VLFGTLVPLGGDVTVQTHKRGSLAGPCISADLSSDPGSKTRGKIGHLLDVISRSIQSMRQWAIVVVPPYTPRITLPDTRRAR
jgi:hypothetical protein